MLLKNKNALIYGAGGAVGSAVARAFAAEGARVFLAGRTLASVDAVAGEIAAKGGVAETAQVDALDEAAVERHVDAVIQKAGGIDILFNAIGMEDVQGTLLVDMPLEDFMMPVITAARTQFLTARAVARRMSQQGSGVILTITAGPPEATAYIGGFGPACGAVEGLWRGLAAELGPRGVSSACARLGRRIHRTSSGRLSCTLARPASRSMISSPASEAELCSGDCRRLPKSRTLRQ